MSHFLRLKFFYKGISYFPNTIRFGNENGGKTFGICGYGGGKLRDIAQRSLVINCNDTQKVEDIHLIIFHCAMQSLIRQVY